MRYRILGNSMLVGRLTLGCAFSATTLFGCAELDSGSDTCVDDPGCREKIQVPEAGDGPAERTAWSCLQEPFVPTDPMPPGVGVVSAVVDFNNMMTAIPNLDVKVCGIGDSPCALDLAKPQGGMDPLVPVRPVPNQPVAFQMGLRPEFAGYLRMEAEGYLATEYYFGNELKLNLESVMPPNPAPVVFAQAMTVPLEERIVEFFMRAGETRITGTGLLALRAFDCFGERADGVRFELIGGETENTFKWYFVNGVPVATSVQTDGQGVGGFANVPPVAREVRGIAPDGTPFGRIGFEVKANTLLFAEVRPEGPYGRSSDLAP